jgi:adenosylcobyric acid synthase
MKYRPLMFLGTGSDVGKSVLAAGFCRIFSQDGIRVAPFKAQNMALNSFVTSEGGEMGRAQVVQAQAAGIDPSVDMNPILLKPNSEMGSQIIIQGKVYGNMAARDYYSLKKKLVKQVMDSWKRLVKDYELIVLEGAGSAAELNLKPHDLVNFSMAKRADASVILVADIDRGGVFAATIGTYKLLTRKERQLLKGFIINKFRGDPELFKEGVDIIEKKTGLPVFGVVPHIRELDIPQEDSVALDKKLLNRKNATEGQINIGVFRLPHLSNYTDFDPLEQDPAINLLYIQPGENLQALDLLIIPGSKNTISDLNYLKSKSIDKAIIQYSEQGGVIIGICGGFQLLGNEINDPHGVEGKSVQENGLGLLPIETAMSQKKTMTQVKARGLHLSNNSTSVTGYEIHMGITEVTGRGRPFFEIYQQNGHSVNIKDGWIREDGKVLGTYIHGIFDNDNFRKEFLGSISAKYSKFQNEYSFQKQLDSQFDKLAALLRQHIDMSKIYPIINKA